MDSISKDHRRWFAQDHLTVLWSNQNGFLVPLLLQIFECTITKRSLFSSERWIAHCSPHLSVFSRVHCFHYLIPLAKEGNYAIVANVESMDYDPLVVKLNKDISAIEEAMSASLQQHKFQYIFEGQPCPIPACSGERRGRWPDFSLLSRFKTCGERLLEFLYLFCLKQQCLVSLYGQVDNNMAAICSRLIRRFNPR